VERQLQTPVQAPQPTVSHSAVSSSAHGPAEHAQTSSIKERGDSAQPALQDKDAQGHVRSQAKDSGIPVIIPTRTLVSEGSTLSTQEQLRHQSRSGEPELAVPISIPSTRPLLPKANPASASVQNVSDGNAVVAEEESRTRRPSITANPTTRGSVGHSEEQGIEPAAKRRKVTAPTAVTVTNPPHTTASASTASISIQTAPPVGRTSGPAPTTSSTTATENTSGRTKSRKVRQRAKAKGKQRSADGASTETPGATGGDVDSAPARPRKKRKKRSEKGEKDRRRRSSTPEDAETIEIEPNVVTMADLCKDLRTGKKSNREKALQARDAEELLKKQQQQEQQEDATVNPLPTPSDEPHAATNTNIDSAPGGSSAHVPGVRIVNGQLVLDESTRTIDRVALANEARGEGEEVVVVDSLSHKVNNATYSKKTQGFGKRWNEEKTDKFYDGLRMFGTDFGMICKMFPGVSRRTVKLKFTHEERADPTRIKETLLGEKIPVDMEAFSKLTNTVYMDPADLERDLEEDRKKLEEEQAKEKEAMDEAVRQRAAEAAAEAATDEANRNENSSAKENEVQDEYGAKGRKRAKRKPRIEKPSAEKVGRRTKGTTQPHGPRMKASKSTTAAKKAAKA
jgi:transcription factor TFIIIB component B''